MDVEVIHGWCRETTGSDYERYRSTLSLDELAKCDRLYFAADRHDYANAHDLLRRTLSRYHATPPDAWRFQATPQGKPVLVPGSPGAAARLTFNLSHTRQIVACVVSRGMPVGIDVERGDRLRDAMSVAARFFSSRETTDLRACASDGDRTRRFIELWTLKESFIKATGQGLSQPLESFSFDLDADQRIRFVPPPDVCAATWHFWQYELASGVILAIAVCGVSTAPPMMRLLVGEEARTLRPHRATSLSG
jgi:4'-phosphopantetheinyl transferase